MIIGHELTFAQLKRDAETDRLAHAQLFIGPHHVGKTRMAMELAVILQGAADQPPLRKQILTGLDADTLLYLDTGENLSIVEIRAVRERANQSHARPYLVAVIENLGRMKPEAMNALLKTLEEPPAKTVFFLTAHREEDVLPTIRSRCHVTHFHTVGDPVLAAATESSDPEHLVMYAMGRPGKLVRLQKEPEYLELHRQLHQSVMEFLKKPTVPTAFQLSRDLENVEHLEEFLDILLHRTRTLALQGHPLADHLERIEQSKEDLRGNVNKKLVLETLLLSFAP